MRCNEDLPGTFVFSGIFVTSDGLATTRIRGFEFPPAKASDNLLRTVAGRGRDPRQASLGASPLKRSTRVIATPAITATAPTPFSSVNGSPSHIAATIIATIGV